jgi:hypothetical protein
MAIVLIKYFKMVILVKLSKKAFKDLNSKGSLFTIIKLEYEKTTFFLAMLVIV